MTALDAAILLVASAFGGVLNSIAGGGSFLTFPALVLVGVAPITANATSAIALWPGSLAATVAYRRELSESRDSIALLALVSLLGGLIGAALLLNTSSSMFTRIVPPLFLFATLLFSFGDSLTRRIETLAPHVESKSLRRVVAVLFQLFIAVYGGYFGGGMGIMMLATLSLLGMRHVHRMNALKSLLATLINLVAISAFSIAGKVAWQPALLMALSAALGGYFGGATARRLDPKWVRRFVLVSAWSVTSYFFLRTYG